MSDTAYYGTGRRKRSIARVFLSPGKGEIKVNGESFRDYLCRDTLATIVMQPLVAVEGEKAYDINVNVSGGGLTGQAGAIRLGISRALLDVNGEPFRNYLCRDTLATIVMQPLVAIEGEKAYDIKVNVDGGGLTGQAGAIRLGISRALLGVNSDYRSVLKEKGFLTRDARKVERKKPGQPGARKNFQFSKR